MDGIYQKYATNRSVGDYCSNNNSVVSCEATKASCPWTSAIECCCYMLQSRMETISDKLLLLRDREKHDSGKEKSKSPIRAEDVSISSAALALTAKSPDVNSAAISSGRNGNSNNGGYCPSSSPGSNCSSNNSSGGSGTKTKNIGVGANLNGHGRRGKMNGLHGQQHGGPRTVPVPAQQHSPIAGNHYYCNFVTKL